ncbi:hypothetical protein LINPERHAP1_LOCUS24323 [Linum perenne]
MPALSRSREARML